MNTSVKDRPATAQQTAQPAQNRGSVATMPRQPKPADFKELKELTIGELLEDPRVKKAMMETAPRHLSPDRMLRVMSQAIRKTPKLAQCTPLSLLGAMMTCASLGLEPNTPLGECYLIPFEKKKKEGTQWVVDRVEINLIIGYQGLIKLARQSGAVVSLHADVVYEGDDWSFEYGSNQHLRHVPAGSRDGRIPLFAYAHAKLTDGEAFEVLPYEEVMRIRDNTQAYQQAMRDKARAKDTDKRWATTPWIAYPHEMVSKTMVRRLAKWLPKGIEMAAAVQLDSMADRNAIDFTKIAARPELAQDPEGAMADGAEIEVEATETKAQPQVPQAQAETVQQHTDQHDEDGVVQEDGEPGDQFNDYLAKMTTELHTAKTPAGAQDYDKTFKESIVGASERREITDARASELLAAWKAEVDAKMAEFKPKPGAAKAK